MLESLNQAFISLKANLLRSFLTLLALIVGVFSVIVSTTAVAVLDSYFSSTLSLMGGDVIQISRSPSIQIDDGSGSSSIRNRKRLTFDDAETLIEMAQIAKEITPDETFSFTSISHEGKDTEPRIRVVGSNEYYLTSAAYELEDGRNFTPDDIQYGRNVAIIGKEVRDVLFEFADPLGKTIRVDGRSYSVIGALESKGNVFGQSLDQLIVIPFTTGIAAYGGNRNIDIMAKAPNMELIESAIDELTGILRIIRKVAPGDDNDFEIETNDSLAGTFDTFTFFLYSLGFGIGIITLFGAGIGVMNIMLVSVTERTREIGIRKSVGATRSNIVYQFLFEAILVCQIGGAIGMILGIVGGNLLAFSLDISPVIPLWAVISGFFGMLLVGVTFGVYPAWKASKLDPIESLRYE